MLYRSIYVTLTITSAVHDPVFKIYTYINTFLQLKFITNYTENIPLTEQFEH